MALICEASGMLRDITWSFDGPVSPAALPTFQGTLHGWFETRCPGSSTLSPNSSMTATVEVIPIIEDTPGREANQWGYAQRRCSLGCHSISVETDAPRGRPAIVRGIVPGQTVCFYLRGLMEGSDGVSPWLGSVIEHRCCTAPTVRPCGDRLGVDVEALAAAVLAGDAEAAIAAAGGTGNVWCFDSWSHGCFDPTTTSASQRQSPGPTWRRSRMRRS